MYIQPVLVCMYTYIYIYIYREREREREIITTTTTTTTLYYYCSSYYDSVLVDLREPPPLLVGRGVHRHSRGLRLSIYLSTSLFI